MCQKLNLIGPIVTFYLWQVARGGSGKLIKRECCARAETTRKCTSIALTDVLLTVALVVFKAPYLEDGEGWSTGYYEKKNSVKFKHCFGEISNRKKEPKNYFLTMGSEERIKDSKKVKQFFIIAYLVFSKVVHLWELQIIYKYN